MIRHHYIIRIELKDIDQIYPKPDYTNDIYYSLHHEMSNANFESVIRNHQIRKDYFLPRAMYRLDSELPINEITNIVKQVIYSAFENFNCEGGIEKHYSVITIGAGNYHFHNLDPVPNDDGN
ncbi:MAG: hypothetical protein WC756_05000 [Taibaiella sp.]|jgi:hypothetical protein